MIRHQEITDVQLYAAIRRHAITMGGNSNLKIYGLLSCASGRRMKRANRVFFASATEAVSNNYRPCGHCMHKEYVAWKTAQIKKG